MATIKPTSTIELSSNFTEGGGASFIGRDAVEVFRLASLISAIRLESKGIRLSRGLSALKIAKVTTGLRTNNRDKQIARLQIMLENAKRAVTYVERDAP